MNMINSEVRIAVLKEYMKKCDLKQAIAFYQWRIMFPAGTELSCPEEVRENLESLSSYFTRSIDISKKVSV